MSSEEQLSAIARLEPSLDTIRSHLWSSPSGGRAAAFVGAGLSLNAETVSSSGPRMVLWREVAARMLQRLDPERAQPGFGDEALHIAQEYEAAFGRRELDRLLKTSIPDSNHEPGLLHQYLLQLPWADVFTTNQDTLLERTLPLVTNRKYDLVTSIEDISATRSPRIVKLHGSLPSQRPLIFTEEDFRTYPTRFAPFVNMVQQSMMENVFCLFGFSGDDPNFLNWSGWVRDALGEHAPVIYLVGVLGLSDSKRRLLESRNVVPLDLAQLFPPVPHTDPGVRHKAALEWVLLSLMAGRPSTNTKWPTNSSVTVPEPRYTKEVRPLRPREPESAAVVEAQPDGNFEPHALYNVWKDNRKRYPGWVVLPKENRTSLHVRTQSFYYRYPGTKGIWQHAEELEPHQAVLLLHEAVWVLERCLIPLQTDQANLIKSSLEKINPFPDSLDLASAVVAPTTQTQDLTWKDSKLDWREVADAWVHLAYALMRLAREDLDVDAFKLWHDRLAHLRELQLEWATRWSHEVTQYYLATLAEKQAREHLEGWPDTSSSPEWTLRKAAAFAELGDFQKAQDLVTQVTARVRRSLQEDQQSIYLLSVESWALSSLQAYTQANRFLRYEDEAYGEHLEIERESYRERLEALKPYRCDPHTERNRFELRVGGHKPELRLEGERVEEQQSFDPGNRRVTRHISSGNDYFEEILPAFGLLKLSDEAGYPLRCPNFYTVREVNRAAEWIWALSPLWAVSAYLRSGKDKELDRWLTRARVATLSEAHVSVLHGMLVNGGRDALSALERAEIPRLSYAHSVLPGIFEVLSRLCFRLDAQQTDDVLDFALDAYETQGVQKDYAYFKPLSNLIQRAVETLTTERQSSFLPKLMELPFPFEFEEGGEASLAMRLPEPSEFLDPGKVPVVNETDELWPSIQKSVPALLDRVRHGGFQVRWRAVWRLLRLHELKALSSEQRQHFAEALWSRLGDNGLPEATNLTLASTLYLPEPEPGMAESALRAFLGHKDIPPVFRRTDAGLSTSGGLDGNYILQAWLGSNRLFHKKEASQVGIDWTADDVATLVGKLCQWSRDEPELSSNSRRMGLFGDIHDRLHLVERCFDEIIYPQANQLSNLVAKNLEELRLRLEAMGHQAVVSLPSSLCLNKSKKQVAEVKRQLRSHLNSHKPEAVRHALQAIRRWVHLADLSLIPRLPEDLLRELVNKISTRRDPELIYAITVMTDITSGFPELLSGSLIEDLLQALEDLLPEVELPDLRSIDAISNQRRAFTVEKRPDAFAFAAELAAALHQVLLNRNKDVPKILEEWQRTAASSVLPEVQDAFQIDTTEQLKK